MNKIKNTNTTNSNNKWPANRIFVRKFQRISRFVSLGEKWCGRLTATNTQIARANKRWAQKKAATTNPTNNSMRLHACQSFNFPMNNMKSNKKIDYFLCFCCSVKQFVSHGTKRCLAIHCASACTHAIFRLVDNIIAFCLIWFGFFIVSFLCTSTNVHTLSFNTANISIDFRLHGIEFHA